MIHGPALADLPLFATLAPWLGEFPDGPPPLADLTNLLARPPVCLGGGGRVLTCVEPDPAIPAYEVRVHGQGEIPTRPGDWHDFFNALVWRAFPQAKAALNRRHLVATRATPGRGPVRDALTQFDECGVLVCCADSSLAEGLAAHRWEAVFQHRREAVRTGMRFLIFGHASYDQLRAPFPGLCGKALYRIVSTDWLARDAVWQREEADDWLAAWLSDPAQCTTPRVFSPLPLQGIPGVTVDSEDPAYYRDTAQFRPLPSGRRPAALAGV